LLAEVTLEDIKRVMFSYNGSKAPDPDGVSADFYKKSWGIMGVDVTEAVLHFFQNGKILKAINSTSITLVPKIRNASKALDYRPISCCFILYKCISKSWLIEQDMFCLAL
jgi:hypothetical protein